MAELLESPGNFYLNAEQYNTTSEPIEASITIQDRSDILSRQDNWMVHVTRFAIDTQASLYYIPPDPTATVTLTVYTFVDTDHHRIDQTRHFQDRRMVTMDKGASTLAEFLEILNDGVPTLFSNTNNQAHAGLAHVAGSKPTQKAGIWTITPSGTFKFKAGVYKDGQPVTLAAYHNAAQEYFVNIKCSTSMQKLLGFKNANLNILGNESTVLSWKKTMENFYAMLPDYRNNVDNWRWTGAEHDSHRSAWWQEMYPLITDEILEAIPLESAVDENGHYNGTVDRDQLDAPSRPTDLGFWKGHDYVVSNYRKAHIGGADSHHEATFFAKIHTLNHGVHGDSIRFEANGLDDFPPPDGRWDDALNGTQAATYGADLKDAHANVKWPMVVNAKQLWGSWNRAYIIDVENPRQIIVNKEVLTNTAQPTVEITNSDDGHAPEAGPQVGDTMFIPDCTTYSGEPHLGEDTSWANYQRAVVLAVEPTTVVRAAGIGLAADAGYRVTLDCTIESHANRLENLKCDAAGIPQARVIFGSRRIPFSHPMVYVARVKTTVNAAGGMFVFETRAEFPIMPNDVVYVGHRFSASKIQHMVTGVNFATGAITMESGLLTQLEAGMVVIGFGDYSAFNAVLDADKVSHQITCISPFVNGRANTVDHAAIRTKLANLEIAFEGKPSLRHISIRNATNYGIHTLTEEETNVPVLNSIQSATGNVSLSSGVVVAGNQSGFNTAAISDFNRYMGANAYFDSAQTHHHAANNQNLCPSNYFNIDLPPDNSPVRSRFRDFMTAHVREDWSIAIDSIGHNDVQLICSAARGADNPLDVIPANHIVTHDHTTVVRLQQEWAVPFRVCGMGEFEDIRVENPEAPATTDRKFIVYLFNRNDYPSLAHDASAPFDPEHHQFWMSHMGEEDVRLAQYAATIVKYDIMSGWKEMDAVQSVYKSNVTLALDNVSGVNLSLRSEDNFVSDLSGQVDLTFPYKSISLTSNDLLAVPERSGDANELQPVLSSYSIPSLFSAGVGPDGAVNGFTSSPYGTVTFSEGGSRRYHSLTAIPGGLRRFTVNAVLDPKNDRNPKTKISLPAGGRFSCQLLFVRKI